MADARASHTSTQQWQSFEMRMRHRRLERCLLRAEVALEAGCLAESREALDEARTLDASEPRILEIERDILLAESAPATSRYAAPLKVAAASILAGALGAGAFYILRDIPDARLADASDAAIEQPALEPAAPSLASPGVTVLYRDVLPRAAEAPVVQAPDDVRVAAGRPEPETRAEARPAPPTPQPERRPLPAADVQTARLEPPEPAASSLPPLVTPETVPERVRPERVRDELPVVTNAGATARPPVESAVDRRDLAPTPVRDTPVAAVRETAAPAARPEISNVQAVLARFEAAYSGLNADAASAVWPKVDRRALARAFDGLASQEVSLGHCDVIVSGITARAECVGSSTWTPRVGGGGPRTEPRHWTFDLRKAGEQWRIEQAQARTN